MNLCVPLRALRASAFQYLHFSFQLLPRRGQGQRQGGDGGFGNVDGVTFQQNAQHERREPAATGVRIESEPDDWLPSAPCCGSPYSSFNHRRWLLIAQEGNRHGVASKQISVGKIEGDSPLADGDGGE